MADKWIYFGCGDQSGHYAFEEGTRYRSSDSSFAAFDGTLPPQPERQLYVASFSRLGGWGFSALSWWDRSVDSRPGSNSTILAPSLTIEPDTMLAEAKRRFPWVFDRLPQPIRLLAHATPTLGEG
jgi:hypothetical protein